MFEIITLICLFTALLALGVLAVIDLKTGLLPNEYVLAFAMAGAIFHLSTAYYFLSPAEMVLGTFVGAGLLYLLRGGAELIYKKEALGLGDVKLLGAAGIWLGPYYVLMAMTAGAIAGLLHGLGLAVFKKRPLRQMQLPAGPGFAIGIVVVGFVQFQNIREVLWP